MATRIGSKIINDINNPNSSAITTNVNRINNAIHTQSS